MAFDGFFKRIKVDDYHIDWLDTVFAHRGPMLGIVAHAEQSAMNLGMKGLHPTVHHFRKTGDVRNIAHLEAGIAQGLGRSASANYLNLETFELAREVNNSGLV